jgi:hypothetical protein
MNIRVFVFGFIAGALSLLFVGGLAFYAVTLESRPEQEAESSAELSFGDFFDFRAAWMGRKEAVSYTVTSVYAVDALVHSVYAQDGASRDFVFTLGIVNNSDGHLGGQYPEVYCENNEERKLVLSRGMAREGEYSSGLESGTGTIGMTMLLRCEFSDAIYPEEVVISLEREGHVATFVDPMSVVDRVKWRHEFGG